jgi:hypothetical protein
MKLGKTFGRAMILALVISNTLASMVGCGALLEMLVDVLRENASGWVFVSEWVLCALGVSLPMVWGLVCLLTFDKTWKKLEKERTAFRQVKNHKTSSSDYSPCMAWDP